MSPKSSLESIDGGEMHEREIKARVELMLRCCIE